MSFRRTWRRTLLPALAVPLVVPLLGTGLTAGRQSRPAAQQLLHVQQGAGATMPKVTKRVLPTYPANAAAAGVQGTVHLEIVVSDEGRVIHARVAKSVDEKFGLDREALAAARQWEFTPAVDARGTPLTTLVVMQVTFALSGHTPQVSAEVGELPRRPLSPDDRRPSTPRTAQEAAPPAYTLSTPGLVSPTALRSVEPRYTSKAMRAKIMGAVDLSLVVLPDGSVGETRVVKSLDSQLGLDDEALIAARYWLFEPATLNGRPVASRVTLELTFRLH